VRKLHCFILVLLSLSSAAQQPGADSLPVHEAFIQKKHSTRKWLIGAGTTSGYVGSFIFLNEAWYKDYPRSSFHTFNDIGEWQQIDKIGHTWTAFHTSRFASGMWKWAGLPDKKAILLGTGSSLLYMLSIEYLDGRSAEWGWSWADAGADILGAALFAGQELRWKEQKLQIKFSSHHKSYAPGLKERADDLFGSSFQGRLLKDYNAQAYWMSIQLKALFPESKLPGWLNLSLGYGAEGMYGGYENIAYDKSGNLVFDRRDIKRYRQWYLAPDVDLTRIKTKSKFLKTAFFALNVLKFPAPALEFSNGRLKLRALAF
jgi:hypothetical protein